MYMRQLLSHMCCFTINVSLSFDFLYFSSLSGTRVGVPKSELAARDLLVEKTESINFEFFGCRALSTAFTQLLVFHSLFSVL